MTPWMKGAFTATLWGLVGGLAAAVTIAAIWALAPSHTADGVARDVWTAGEYTAAWGRYLAGGGSWVTAYQSAQWQPVAVAAIAALGGLVVLVCVAGVVGEQMRPSLHGTAAFATVADCQDMGIVAKRGYGNVVLGEFRGAGLLAHLGWRRRTMLMASAPRHVMVIAGTRSGKSAGVLAPSLLAYLGSQIVVDPKRELLEKIGPVLRERGVVIYEIDWSEPSSPHAWNPLALSVLPKNIVALESHCLRVAGVMFRPSEAKGSEKYFQDNALRNCASLFLYAALEAQAAGKDAHPSDAIRLISDFKALRTKGGLVPEDADLQAELLAMLAASADIRGYPESVVNDLEALSTMVPKQRDDHINTLKTGLQVFRSTAVKGSTRETSFTWQDLRDHRAAVFIAFPESDAVAYGHLTSLFFDTFFAWAVDNPCNAGGQAINVVAEEFSSIPQLNLLDSYLSKGAGHNTTITMVVQSMMDLQKHYDQVTAERLLENIDYFVIFAITDKTTRELFSGLAGTKTVIKKSRSGGIFGRSNVTESETPVPLIPPEALGELPFRQHLVFVKRHFTRPVICTTPLHALMKPS